MVGNLLSTYCILPVVCCVVGEDEFFCLFAFSVCGLVLLTTEEGIFITICAVKTQLEGP